MRTHHTLLVLSVLLIAQNAVGQTASNTCSFAAGSQYPVGNTCNYLAFNKPGSFTSAITATGCTGSGNDDAFGWFQATSTTTVVTYTATSFNTNPIIHLYTGTCAALVGAGCVNATGAVPFLGSATETISLPTVVGQNYLVRIQNQGSNTAMNGQLCVLNPPVNDNCNNAIALPVFASCFSQTFSNSGTTPSGTSPAPICSTTPSTDVWFSFVAPASGAVRIESTAGTLTDGAFQLYTGTCGGLSLVAGGCDDDSGPGNMPYLDRRCTPLTGGVTYFIRYWGYNGATGTFDLCVHGPDVFPTPQQDCAGGFTICNSGGISNVSDNSGCVQDLTSANHGCLGSTTSWTEHQGTWYYFSPQAAGNYGFNLQPVNAMGNPANVDYDFAVWGPMNTIVCPPTTAPLRCSYALPNQNGGNYTTGMAAGNSDVSEGASGSGVNGFTSPINVSAANVGQIYVMFLDNFTATGQAFTLNWTLPSPTALDCTLLPIRILSFHGRRDADDVLVQWVAQTSAGTERFMVQHSANGTDFTTIGVLDAVSSGSATTDYELLHKDPLNGSNYYRLEQVDSDGSHYTSEVVYVEMRSGQRTLIPRPNPASSVVYMDLPQTGSDTYQLNLMDASGRIARSLAGRIGEGSDLVEIPLTGLDAGCYLVHLLDANGVAVASGRFIRE